MLASPAGTLAATFPDVPDGHVFQEPIERLADSGVVKGNPDGTYGPDKEVNRAEMLTMLYRATGRVPDPASTLCFPDAEPGSWYESVVCDAAVNKFVSGYPDGKFRPGNSVTRVEALKMIHTVFGFDVGTLTDDKKDLVKFVDVSTSAWYTGYLANAHIIGILPIAGQHGAKFNPDWPLTRKEAAAYIYNALNVSVNTVRSSASSSASSQFSSGGTQSSASSEAASSSDSSVASETMLSVEFPFSGGGKFSERRPTAYKFSLDQAQTVSITAELNSGQPGSVNCTLYLLGDSGFSDQYHLGTVLENSCYILASLGAGNYQLQLSPTKPNTAFKLTSASAKGDGNDGFIDAVQLTRNSKTAVLEGANFQNWYTFFVSGANTEGKRMKVELSNTANLRCLVYAMNDVDLFGFSSPECNQFYSFPPGTYYIAVGRQAPKDSRQTYTIILRE